MRIFVTGATGYIGSALCQRLRQDGHEVVALVRATSDLGRLQGLGVETFPGDITDRYSMREAMAGADWVVHAAAELDFRTSPAAMRRTNVEGSENVASLAYKLGVGRLLALSSVAAFGGSPPDGSPGTEESPPQLPFPSAYSATKHAGQKAVERWAEQGLRVNVVYPSLVYGPPGKRSGTNALLRALLQGRFPFLIGADRRLSWVHIDDLVDGMVRVMARAEPGRPYLLTGDTATLAEVVTRVCELGGARPPRGRLPLGLALAAVRLGAAAARLVGGTPRLTPDQVRSLGRHWAFDDSRARRELAWQPRTLAEGLPPTVEYLRRES